MATMQDVATLANVSLSTVSYAINNTRPISAATRERIERGDGGAGLPPQRHRPQPGEPAQPHPRPDLPGLENRLGGTVMEFVDQRGAGRARAGHHLVVWPYAPDAVRRDLET